MSRRIPTRPARSRTRAPWCPCRSLKGSSRARSRWRESCGREGHLLSLDRQLAEKVRVLVLDVDGVLTRAQIVLGTEGELLMEFSARDGIGIKIAQHAGIEVTFLSARAPAIVERRAKMLGVTDVRLGHERKLPIVREIAGERGVALENVAYVGDDLVDREPVASVGLGVAVGDACRDLKEATPFVTEAPGGGGAVREVVEAILRARGEWSDTVDAYFERLAERRSRAGGREE
ncbi:MAG: HAD hydrolase family protein [Candidatus Eisenbacteria bacterium]|nr:HAD hydrolase family protein [Candidatus Eisenbacteria bacterium]